MRGEWRRPDKLGVCWVFSFYVQLLCKRKRFLFTGPLFAFSSPYVSPPFLEVPPSTTIPDFKTLPGACAGPNVAARFFRSLGSGSLSVWPGTDDTFRHRLIKSTAVTPQGRAESRGGRETPRTQHVASVTQRAAAADAARSLRPRSAQPPPTQRAVSTQRAFPLAPPRRVARPTRLGARRFPSAAAAAGYRPPESARSPRRHRRRHVAEAEKPGPP